MAADAILIVHALFVAFVVGGLVLVMTGGLLGWGWVRHRGFRLAHLAAIAIVVLQSWLGMICPLTIWEQQLRELAGEVAYRESFVAYWLQRLLFYEAPPWVFIMAYTVFAALVLVSWFRIPPLRQRRN